MNADIFRKRNQYCRLQQLRFEDRPKAHEELRTLTDRKHMMMSTATTIFAVGNTTFRSSGDVDLQGM
jgi:hypothetical protein